MLKKLSGNSNPVDWFCDNDQLWHNTDAVQYYRETISGMMTGYAYSVEAYIRFSQPEESLEKASAMQNIKDKMKYLVIKGSEVML